MEVLGDYLSFCTFIFILIFGLVLYLRQTGRKCNMADAVVFPLLAICVFTVSFGITYFIEWLVR